MGIKQWLFGQDSKEVWQQFCKQIDAIFIDGGLWGGEKIEAHLNNWTITLDSYSTKYFTFTRIRVPFINKDGFQFKIYKEHFFSSAEKMLGMQDIQVGDEEVDSLYMIQGNNEDKVKALFNNSRIRELIKLQSNIHFQIIDNKAIDKLNNSSNIDLLYFEVVGLLKDIESLKNAYDLVIETLNHLYINDTAVDISPGISL